MIGYALVQWKLTHRIQFIRLTPMSAIVNTIDGDMKAKKPKHDRAMLGTLPIRPAN